MKKTFCTLVACVAFLSSLQAQENPLVGMWTLMNNGQPTPSGKIFFPDGRMYGYTFNDDGTDMSTWIMANYDTVNDSTYIEKPFFHTAINYQETELEMTFKMAPDSQSYVSSFTYIQPNGSRPRAMELWTKDANPDHQKYIDRVSKDWDELHQQALKQYNRIPAEGETVEEKGTKLLALIQANLMNNKLDPAYEALLVCAELDPSNLEWQRNLVNFYHATNSAPSPSIAYGKRLLNLAKAQASSPRDSTLQQSVFLLTRLHLIQGNLEEGCQLLRDQLAAEEACQDAPTEITGILYNIAGGMCYNMGKWEEALDYALKGIKTFEATNSPNVILHAQTYSLAGLTKLKLGAYKEVIPYLEKELQMLPPEAPEGIRLKEDAEPLLVLCLQEEKTKAAQNRIKELLKGKVWAFRLENPLDSVAIALGMKSNTIYYPLVNENIKWDVNNPTPPLAGISTLLGDKDEEDEDTSGSEEAFMSEEGDLIVFNGSSNIQSLLMLKPGTPELKAKLQKALRDYKAAKKAKK